jgi:uncharacterized CHY-type Zn-finger protein
MPREKQKERLRICDFCKKEFNYTKYGLSNGTLNFCCFKCHDEYEDAKEKVDET